MEVQNMDISQMLEMANMLGTMLKPTDVNNKEEIKTIEYKPIPFDEELQTEDMKIIKAVIPYMNLTQQKLVGIFIKIMEIRALLNKTETEVVSIQTNNEQLHKDILLSVKPYCSQDKQNAINMIIRMLEMKNILVQIEDLKGVL